MRRRFPLPSRLARNGDSPWKEIVAASPPGELGGEGTRVLMATSVGSHPLAPVIDGLVGASLAQRGAAVSLLLCDGALQACEACAYTTFPKPSEFIDKGPQKRLCGPCLARGERYHEPLPLRLHRYRDHLDDAELDRARSQAEAMSAEECRSFELRGLELGEQVNAALLRFFGKADLSSEADELVLAAARRYAAGAIATATMAERLFESERPEVIVAHHGIYVPQGVLGTVARRDGVRVVNWGPAYRDTTVLFSHGDTYHHTMLAEPAEHWDQPLSEEQEAELLRYLASRRVGKGDWNWITPDAALRIESQARDRLIDELELDRGKETFGLLTNVIWDAQLHFRALAFRDMLDWLWMTLDHFEAHPERQLIVRIHPHEIKEGNRQPVADEIRRRYPELAPNIKIVPHDHPFNTYALMDLCRAVLIYGTKTGVELAPLGIPVVVGGDAWVRGKGFTHDISEPAQYEELLDGLTEIGPLTPDQISRARRYAYHYFFRRMIPISSIEPDSGVPPRLRIETLGELGPGIDRGLDTVCDGILNGKPFAYDA